MLNLRIMLVFFFCVITDYNFLVLCGVRYNIKATYYLRVERIPFSRLYFYIQRD